MATSFVVISTDLRRTTVKVPSGGYMIDVLEEACTKLKLASEQYQLKHNTKAINLTDPVRAAGLPQGAKLELVVKSKSPSAVTVALRLPPSEASLGLPNNRVSAKVRSDTPLWKLLRHLEESDDARTKKLNLTARGVPLTAAAAGNNGAGQLYWETPVLRFAGRELATLDDFQKTLSQVGIDTGSQLIMLDFRISDLPLQQAMETVHKLLEKTDAEASANKASAAPAAPAPPAPASASETAPESAPESISESASEPALAPAESSATRVPPPQDEPKEPAAPPTEAMEIDQPPAASHASHLHPVQVWSPSKAGAGMPAAASLRWAQESDASALAPTIAQMKAHQKHLEEAGRNKRLKSDEELEAEKRDKEAKAAAVNKVDVRIRFPDGYTAMWSFPNGATGATLHAAVRGILADHVRAMPFRLVPPMSREEIQDDDGRKHDLVRGYGMRGGVVVNFLRGSGVGAPAPGKLYVKHEVAVLAQDITIPQVPDEEEDKGPAQASVTTGGGQNAKRANKGDVASKMGKFLRLAKK